VRPALRSTAAFSSAGPPVGTGREAMMGNRRPQLPLTFTLAAETTVRRGTLQAGRSSGVYLIPRGLSMKPSRLEADLGRRPLAVAGFVACLAAIVAGCIFLPAPAPASTATVSPTARPSVVATTGVRGTVTAGPTCPVERADQSPCIRAVPDATIVATDAAGKEVARAMSDGSGAYFLQLPPGTYRIVPQPVAGLMGTAAAETVQVTSGAATRLDFAYDTGIR
jgi:hypothetical protein